ncbi:hypothetical protein C8R45DRAFT_992934 [Mycena sanguinolenta]|nr:hypothetical protein C8R45DRAFT_992934 [Mycena sanguinolenta]
MYIIYTVKRLADWTSRYPIKRHFGAKARSLKIARPGAAQAASEAALWGTSATRACSILAQSGPLRRCLRSWHSSLGSRTQSSSILSIAGAAARADFAPCCTAHALQHNQHSSRLTDLGSRKTCARSILTSGLLDASAPASSTGCETREGMCRERKDVGAHLSMYPRGKYFSSTNVGPDHEFRDMKTHRVLVDAPWAPKQNILASNGNMITAPKLHRFLVLRPEMDKTKAQKGLFGFPCEMVKFRGILGRYKEFPRRGLQG